MKHRAFTFVEIVIVLILLVGVAALLFPLFARSRESHGYRSPDSICQSNLKQIGLGFRQYIQDYDEKYPPASVAWATVYLPYIKSTQVFQCPSEPTPPGTTTTDYFFNARLLGVELRKIASSASTIATGDGAGNRGPNYTLLQLPLWWRTDQNSPARRHRDGANYGFADGHVKWLKHNRVTLDKPNSGQPTFLIQ